MKRPFLYMGVTLLMLLNLYVYLSLFLNPPIVPAYRLAEAGYAALSMVAALSLLVSYSASSPWFALAATIVRFVLVTLYWIHCPNLRGATLLIYALLPLVLLGLCIVALRTRLGSDKMALQ